MYPIEMFVIKKPCPSCREPIDITIPALPSKEEVWAYHYQNCIACGKKIVAARQYYTGFFYVESSDSTEKRRPEKSARFSDNVKVQAYHRQKGRCAMCGDPLDIYYAHHIRRIADGGDGSLDNCAMLCFDCHDQAHNYGRYREPLELCRSSFPYFDG